MRIGNGYDVHRLVPDRKLIIGGVRIPFEKGLLGHSDADVLTHAIIDALLGAAALGDIGAVFPDTSDDYKDINSMLLLRQVGGMLREKGYAVVNIDSVVVAQRPKLAPYIADMRAALAQALEMTEKDISVKAKTEETLGFTGAELGMAAYAVVLIK